MTLCSGKTCCLSPVRCHPRVDGDPGRNFTPVAMKKYWVYFLCSKKNGTLYVGITSNLVRRVHEHKEKVIEGFTHKYSVTCIVYAEEYGNIHEAIAREKRIKKWNRAWKIRLIEGSNPDWNDLYQHVI